MANILAKGIDVSHWQGNIDFSKVKAAGFSFVIIKAGGADNGYYKDSCFEKYYKDAVAAGLHVGTYYFTGKNFYTAEQGKREAAEFIKLLKGKKFDYPVSADVEAVPTSVGKSRITDAVIAFCDALIDAGYYANIYASDISGFKSRMDASRLTAYDKWVAKYSKTPPTYITAYGMWQFGGSQNYLGSVKVAGVSSAACDQDYSYKDYPAIIKAGGFNGYTKTNTDTETQADKPTENTDDWTKAKCKNDAAKNGKEYTVNCKLLNFRKGAGTDQPIIRTLSRGTKLMWYGYYTQRNNTTWLYVAAPDGVAGFVSKGYLKG